MDGLGPTLRRLRIDAGWTQADTAARSGLTASFVSDIERGYRNPSPRSAVRLADAYGITAAQLLRLADQYPQKA